MQRDLQSIGPREAMRLYLDDRVDLRSRSVEAHRYRLRQLVKWLEAEGFDDLNDLTGRDLARFRHYRVSECGVAPATLQGNSYTYKAFFDFCESIEAVQDGLAAKVRIPSLNEDDLVRDHDLHPDRVRSILDHIGRFSYASRTHAMLALFFHVGCRSGALRGLDIRDVHLDDRYVEFRHRPETDTPLKNGRDGERPVALADEVATILGDYFEVNRVSQRESSGRRPFFTTAQGRVSQSSIRESMYRVTRPCMMGDCPHDRDPETCEAMETGLACKCPSSRAPHDIRSASITRMLREDKPRDAIEKRVNATEEVIEEHYDERTLEERREFARNRMEERRDYFDEI